MNRNKKLALLGGALALTGLVVGTQVGDGYAAKFSSTTGGTSTLNAGKIEVGNFGNTGANPSYTTTVANLYPGDTAYRFFNVENTGSMTLGQLMLIHTVSGQLADLPAPSKVYPGHIPNQTTSLNGVGGKPVLMGLQGCTQPWDYTAGAAPTCGGTTYSYYASKPANTLNGNSTLLYSGVATSGTTVTKVSSGTSYVNPYGFTAGMPAGKTLYFMSSYQLPLNSTNEYQGTAMKVTWALSTKQYPTG